MEPVMNGGWNDRLTSPGDVFKDWSLWAVCPLEWQTSWIWTGFSRSHLVTWPSSTYLEHPTPFHLLHNNSSECLCFCILICQDLFQEGLQFMLQLQDQESDAPWNNASYDLMQKFDLHDSVCRVTAFLPYHIPTWCGWAGQPDWCRWAGQPDWCGWAGQPDWCGRAGQPDCFKIMFLRRKSSVSVYCTKLSSFYYWKYSLSFF